MGHYPLPCGPPSCQPEMEYIITFVDCYSKYAILIPSKDHMSQMVSNTLLDRVISYFGVPRWLLSDRGREFTKQVWNELFRTLGVQRVLTSPYDMLSTSAATRP